MKFVSILVLVPSLLARPQEGFGDASEQEIAEIRAGSYLETVDDNPTYNFKYKVADEDEQTYIAMDEERAGDIVTGSYSYVDPYGSLIVVNYSAGPMGYTETREVQEGFVTIRARPARKQAAVDVNAVAQAEAQRLEAQRLENQRLENQRQEAARQEAARLEAQRQAEAEAAALAAAQAEAAALAAAQAEAERLAAAQAEADRIAAAQAAEAARQEALRAEAARAEAARLEAARAEAARIEAERNAQLEAASAGQSQDELIAQIVAQISPLVSQTVSSTVAGQSQGRNRITRVRVPARIAPVAAPVASSAASEVVNVFGQGGDYNVKFHTPDFKIEY